MYSAKQPILNINIFGQVCPIYLRPHDRPENRVQYTNWLDSPDNDILFFVLKFDHSHLWYSNNNCTLGQGHLFLLGNAQIVRSTLYLHYTVLTLLMM